SISEAVWLGDRVVVVGGRPGRIVADIAIDLPRPRGKEHRFSPVFSDYVTEIESHIGVTPRISRPALRNLSPITNPERMREAMLSITADAGQVVRTYGLEARKSLLFSAIRLDSYPLVAPLIARTDDEEFLLVRQQEQGNALSAGVPKDRIKFYAPWVTIDPRIIADTPAATSLTDLVRELAAGSGVQLAADVVYSHYLALAGAVDLSVADQAPTPVTAYEIDTDEVLGRFAAWRATGVETARRLIDGVEHLAGLEKEFTTTEDSRYSALRSLSDDRSLDALLLAAPPNFTEATGFAQPDGAVAVWLAGSEKLLVLIPEGGAAAPGAPIGRFASVGAAVRELARGPRTGVEDEWIGIGLARELEREQAELVPVSRDLGHWRDIRD